MGSRLRAITETVVDVQNAERHGASTPKKIELLNVSRAEVGISQSSIVMLIHAKR